MRAVVRATNVRFKIVKFPQFDVLQQHSHSCIVEIEIPPAQSRLFRVISNAAVAIQMYLLDCGSTPSSLQPRIEIWVQDRQDSLGRSSNSAREGNYSRLITAPFGAMMTRTQWIHCRRWLYSPIQCELRPQTSQSHRSTCRCRLERWDTGLSLCSCTDSERQAQLSPSRLVICILPTGISCQLTQFNIVKFCEFSAHLKGKSLQSGSGAFKRRWMFLSYIRKLLTLTWIRSKVDWYQIRTAWAPNTISIKSENLKISKPVKPRLYDLTFQRDVTAMS